MVEIRRMEQGDVAADLALTRASFLFPEHKAEAYLATPPSAGWVALGRGGSLLAGLKAERMGQNFGGRAVSAAAIFGVKVSLEARGRGIGRAILEQALRDLRDEGVAMATLYPSDTRAYRRCGFEVAGSYARHRIDLAALETPRGAMVERWEDPDPLALDEALRRHVGDEPGPLVRSERWWRARVLQQVGDERLQCLVARGDDAVRGYALLDRLPSARNPSYFESSCRDLVWTDIDALAGLLRALAANRAVSAAATVAGAASHPLSAYLDPQAMNLVGHRVWMTRLTNPAGFLSSRGYGSAVSGSAVLLVHDPLTDTEEPPFRFSVNGRAGNVTAAPSEDPDIEMDVATLASVATGWLRPRAAVGLGRMLPKADAEAVDFLEAAFAGRPWMSDLF